MLLASVAAGAIAACNIVSGVSDLQVGETTPTVEAGGREDAAADVTTAPRPDSAIPTEAGPNGDADGADGRCTTELATLRFGAAVPLPPYTQLVPETNGMAGGIASATEMALADFDASFSYSMTNTSASTAAAGVAFFALASSAKDLTCQPGPFLCALGGTTPGFAVIIRTSKGNQGDPPVPYVAVVDAQTYPGVSPTVRTDLAPATAYSLVNPPNTGVPAPGTLHAMTIRVRAGLVSAAIDGAAVLTDVPIPGWLPGRASTWGVGASTGLGSSFASRTVVGDVALTHCP